jgi:probable addiction module antidote protein
MAKSKLKKKSNVRARTATYSRFSVSDYLESDALRAEYLSAWFDDRDSNAADIARALGDIARAHGMRSVAKETGLSRESLYRALSKDGNPTLETFLKVTRACGIRLAAQSVNRSRERP